jgi:hypothetical protein
VKIEEQVEHQVELETYPGEKWLLKWEGLEISALARWNWERYHKSQPTFEQFIADFLNSSCQIPPDKKELLKESPFCQHLGLTGKLSELAIQVIASSHP